MLQNCNVEKWSIKTGQKMFNEQYIINIKTKNKNIVEYPLTF